VSAGEIAGLVVAVIVFLYLCYALFQAERF